MGRKRWGAAAAALVLIMAGCSDDGGDDEDAADTTTTEASDDTTTTEAGDDADDGELTELCALATEMDEQEDFPSAAQLEQYKELAPDEIADAVDTAADPLIAAEGDLPAFFVAFADDDVAAAVDDINAFETEECGIDHSDDGLGGGEDEAADGAEVVDVVASEYTFDVGDVAAGNTSFRLTNEGEEAHFLLVVKLADGHTIDDVLASEGDPAEEGITEDPSGETALAAPGGEDEEFVTLDLVPGDYAFLCFIPGPDGTRRARRGGRPAG
jgi:hypothetical protein